MNQVPFAMAAIAAMALCPILNAMGSIGNMAGNVGFFLGAAYFAWQAGMILEERLEALAAKPARRRREVRRSTGRAVTLRR